MGVQLRWHGKEFERFTDEAMFHGIRVATADLQRIAKKKASIANTGVSMTRKRDTTRGSKGSTYTVYPNPSSPGESPRMRTRQGQASIQKGTDRKRIAGRVGFMRSAMYMAMWEVGIKGVQRPTIVPATRNNIGRLSQSFRRGALAFANRRQR